MTLTNNLVALLVAGIKAAQNPAAQPLLATTYLQIKSLLRSYPTLDLQALERRPDALGKQLSLAEDLAELGVIQNLECLAAFTRLAQYLITETTTATALGVDLSQIKAAELKIREIQSSGLGVRIHEAAIDQNIEIDAVHAGAAGQTNGGRNGGGIVFTEVTAGGDIIINSPVDPHAAHIAALRSDYLFSLFRRVDTIFLSHVSPQSQVAARISLKAVYTAQLTHTLAPLRPEPGQKGGNRAKRPVALQERQLTAVESMNHYQHLVLLGAPGSGKSSFLKFMALCMAGALLPHPEANLTLLHTAIPLTADTDIREPLGMRQEEPWAHGALLPVYIPLRELAAAEVFAVHEQGNVEGLFTFLTQELARVGQEAYAPYLRQELLQNGGLLLLDGLDEVADGANQRRQIGQAIAEFSALYPRCRIVLSSRPYAYQDPAWQLPGFTEVMLAPFAFWQIERFVDAYYAHLLRAQGAAALNSSQAQADRFKAAIKTNTYLRELATTPLLLTLMVSLLAWRGGALPDNDDELYAHGVDLLLNEWERPKLEPTDDDNAQPLALSVHEWLEAPQQNIRYALEELAFQAHAQQNTLETVARIPESAVVAALLRAAGPSARPGRLTEYIQNRAGLLINHGDGSHSFPHRTIQEYLAACYLTRIQFPKQLVDLVRNDPQRWREVLLLAGGKAARGSPFTVWALIDRLCPLPYTEPTAATATDWWMALLAGRLLTTTQLHRAEALDQSELQTLTTVKGWLLALIKTQQLPAPDRALAGADLGLLGDPRPGVGLTAAGLPDLDWVAIPAGPFLMGARPFLCDWITTPYCISRYPITQAQYAAFIKADGYRLRDYWTDTGWQWLQAQAQPGPALYPTLRASPNQPQVGICWYEAVAFCHWLTAVTGAVVGLPSEAQWERAARHTDGRLYPWGNHFAVTTPQSGEGQSLAQQQTGELNVAQACNMRQSGIAQSSPVGLFPAGHALCGAADLAGNVWEWCATPWRNSYTANAPAVDHGLTGAARRVLRGGSWANDQHLVRCAHRHRNHPDHRGPNVGFRVAMIEPASSTPLPPPSDFHQR